MPDEIDALWERAGKTKKPRDEVDDLWDAVGGGTKVAAPAVTPRPTGDIASLRRHVFGDVPDDSAPATQEDLDLVREALGMGPSAGKWMSREQEPWERRRALEDIEKYAGPIKTRGDARSLAPKIRDALDVKKAQAIDEVVYAGLPIDRGATRQEPKAYTGDEARKRVAWWESRVEKKNIALDQFIRGATLGAGGVDGSPEMLEATARHQGDFIPRVSRLAGALLVMKGLPGGPATQGALAGAVEGAIAGDSDAAIKGAIGNAIFMKVSSAGHAAGLPGILSMPIGGAASRAALNKGDPGDGMDFLVDAVVGGVMSAPGGARWTRDAIKARLAKGQAEGKTVGDVVKEIAAEAPAPAPEPVREAERPPPSLRPQPEEPPVPSLRAAEAPPVETLGAARPDAHESMREAEMASGGDPRVAVDKINETIGGMAEDLLSGSAVLTNAETSAVSGAWRLLSRTIGSQGTAADIYEVAPSGATRADVADAMATIKHVHDLRVRRGVMPSSQADTSLPKPALEAETAPTGEAPVPVKTAPVETPGAASPRDLTSIKNRIVDYERAERHVAPMPDTTPRPMDAVEAEARRVVTENPTRAETLSREVAEKPRPLTDVEDAILAFRRVDLHKERARVDAEIVKASNEGRLDDVAKAMAERTAVNEAFLQAEVASKGGGAETARGLNARKWMAAQDHSLLAMETTRRVEANEGKPLTPEQAAETKALHERLAIADKRIAEYEAREAKAATPGASRKAPGRATEYGARNRIVTREAYEAAKKILLTPSAGMPAGFAGVSPEKIAALVKMGAYHVEAGARSFTTWAAKMREDVGDKFDEGELRRIYVDSRKEVARERKPLTNEQRVERALEATERSIAEWERRTTTGDVFPGERQSKTPSDPRLDALRARRDALAKKAADMKAAATPRDTDAQRTEKTVAELQRRVDTGDVFPEAREAKPVDPRITTLRQKIADMRAAATPTKPADAAQIKRLEKNIAEIERRTAEGDFTKKERKQPVASPEKVALYAKRDMALQAWHEALIRDRIKNENAAQTTARVALEASHAARSVMTSLDVSAVLRQAGPATIARPGIAAKGTMEMFRAMGSPEAQARIEAAIRLDPDYHHAKRAGLALTETGPSARLDRMEEAYMSRWVPQLAEAGRNATSLVGQAAGLLPRAVDASQRGYVTYLNKVRFDYFKSLLATLRKGREPTLDEARAVATMVNVFTGRGGPRDSHNLALANAAFFSPRLWLSRVQFLAGPLTGFQTTGGGSLRTRLLMAKEYARFFSGTALLYAIGLAAGATIEDDPRSSDFGKMRWGNTRLDPMGGLLQNVTLAERLRTGERKNPIDAEEKPGQIERSDVGRTFWHFLRTKFAPIPGAGFSTLEAHHSKKGKDIFGNKTSALKEAGGLVTPLSIRDVYKVMTTDLGIEKKAALTILSLFGMGLRVHDERR